MHYFLSKWFYSVCCKVYFFFFIWFSSDFKRISTKGKIWLHWNHFIFHLQRPAHIYFGRSFEFSIVSFWISLTLFLERIVQFVHLFFVEYLLYVVNILVSIKSRFCIRNHILTCWPKPNSQFKTVGNLWLSQLLSVWEPQVLVGSSLGMGRFQFFDVSSIIKCRSMVVQLKEVLLVVLRHEIVDSYGCFWIDG